MLNTLCDVAIALPGGVGTLDEVFTLVAANTVGYRRQRVILYNMKGFWDTLVALLNNLEHQGMIRGNYRNLISVVNNLDELEEELKWKSEKVKRWKGEKVRRWEGEKVKGWKREKMKEWKGF